MATTRKQFLPLMGLTAALAAGTFGALLLVNPHHHKEETQADRTKTAKDDTDKVFGGNVENPPAEANTSMPTIPAGAPAAIAVQGTNAASGGCPPGQIPDPKAAGAGAATPASGAAATPSTAAAATPASGAAATPTTGATATAGAAPASPACIPDPNATAVASSGTGAAATPTTTTTPAPTDGGSSTPGTAATTTDTATNTAGAPAPADTSATTTASTATPAATTSSTDTSTTTTAASSGSSGGSTESASSAGGPSPAELRRMIRREAQKIAREEVRKALRARALNEDGASTVASADKPAKKTKKTTTTTSTTTDTAPAATDTAATTTATTTDSASSGATPAPSTAATEVASTSTTTTKTKSGKAAAKATPTASSAGASPGGNAITARPQADALRAWWNDTNTPVGAFTLVYAGQPKNQTSIALLFSDTPALASTSTGIKVVDRGGNTIPNNWAPAPGNPRLLLLSGLTPGRYTVVVNQNMQSTGGRKLISDQTGPVYVR